MNTSAEKPKAGKGHALLAEWLLASSNFNLEDWTLSVRNFVEDECAQEDAAAPSALNAGSDLPDRKWLNTSHYHCKNCGAEMEYLGRANWKGAGGVTAIGVCGDCSLILIEKENTNFTLSKRLVRWVSYD